MRVLVVTGDPSFAIGAARMHADAKVLVASPNQLPSRAAEPFDVAVIDAGSDTRNLEIAERLEQDGTVARSLLVTERGGASGPRPALSRPFTLEELVELLELPGVAGSEDGGAQHGLVGRLLRRIHPGTDAVGTPAGRDAAAPRLRAWPRMRAEDDRRADPAFVDVVAAAERLAGLLADLPPVGSVSEAALALADAGRERLEGRHGVVWLEDGGVFGGHHRGDSVLPPVLPGHAVLSALREDVAAVLLAPPGPAGDLVGVDVPAVAVAGLRYGERFLGAVAVGGRRLTVADRDELLAVAVDHAPRLALAGTVARLRRSLGQ